MRTLPLYARYTAPGLFAVVALGRGALGDGGRDVVDPLQNLYRTASVIVVDGVDGDTGAEMTGTNAGKVLALPGLLTVGAAMSIETSSITTGSGSPESCRICG